MKIKQELEEAKKLQEEYLNDVKRIQAEFENYKKRTEKENTLFIKTANESLIIKLLPFLDDLKSTLVHIEDENIKKGIVLIYKKLWSILEKEGLQEIKTINQKFDPHFHECLLQEESEKEEGLILEELQKGFMLHNKIIRHAKVKIAKSKEENHTNGGKKND